MYLNRQARPLRTCGSLASIHLGDGSMVVLHTRVCLVDIVLCIIKQGHGAGMAIPPLSHYLFPIPHSFVLTTQKQYVHSFNFYFTLLTFPYFVSHHTTSRKHATSYQVSTKITVIRPQPHLGVKAKDFHVDLLSCIQLEYTASRTGILLSWRHILVNHQENAIVGIDSHSVVIVVRSFVEVHLSVDIVTTTGRHLQSSLGILKAVHYMAFGMTTVPRGDY